MFHKSVESQLNGDSNVKDHNFPRGTEAGEAGLSLQKLSDCLLSGRPNYLGFVLHPLTNELAESKPQWIAKRSVQQRAGRYDRWLRAFDWVCLVRGKLLLSCQ